MGSVPAIATGMVSVSSFGWVGLGLDSDSVDGSEVCKLWIDCWRLSEVVETVAQQECFELREPGV